jgi:hypothetical protein
MTVRRSTDPEFPMGICLTLKKFGVAGLDEAHQQHGERQSGRGRYHCSAASSRSIRRANDRSRQAITSRVLLLSFFATHPGMRLIAPGKGPFGCIVVLGRNP